MKTLINRCIILTAVLLFAAFAGNAQNEVAKDKSKSKNETEMKTFVIERNIPGAGKFTNVDLKSISQTSCSVLKDLGPDIQWVHSYVTGDKIYCIYKAKNADIIREHAKRGGFPANSIVEVSSVISPATAN